MATPTFREASTFLVPTNLHYIVWTSAGYIQMWLCHPQHNDDSWNTHVYGLSLPSRYAVSMSKPLPRFDRSQCVHVQGQTVEDK